MNRFLELPVRHSRTFRVLALVTAVAMALGACGPKAPKSTGHGPGGGGSNHQALIQTGDLPSGLDMKVSNGKQGPEAADRTKLAPATKIPDKDAEALLNRLSPIQKQPDDQSPFKLRKRSDPPPRTGKTIKASFPGKPTKSATVPVTNDAGKELTIVRWAPEGDVPIAPQLQVTFSQAMVAVTSHDDTTAQGVPVTLTPQPKGKWRWVGTKTLLFDPEVRFPQATTYKVEIAEGTKSATGNVLKEAKTFTFETPAPTMQQAYPQWGPTKTDVPMFLLFDQTIDAAAVLAKIEVKAGKKTYSVRMLDAAEIEKDATIKSYVEQAKAADQDGRWLAFKTTEELTKDTAVSVTIQKGTPSAEGPNVTKSDQSFNFSTYPPLRITDSYCGWHGSPCPPQTPFNIEFNNPLDVPAWDDAHISVEPAVPGLQITHYGNYVSIYGRTKGRTKYTVVVSGGILDEFGQTLGKDVTLTFRTGDAYPEFYGPSGMVVVDPAAKTPSYDVFTTNYESLKVKLYRVEPKDFGQFARYVRDYWDVKRRPKLPGKKMFDQLVKTGGKKDELTETHIDLTPALGKGDRGHVIAVVEPYPWKERYEPPMLHTWIQVSKIAVDAYVDGEELIAWANKLSDGSSAKGVDLELSPHGLSATTDAKGQAKFTLPAKGGKGVGMLVATSGDDVAFLVDDAAWWSDTTGWIKQARTDSLRWYVTDDRQMYRPGEEVHLKGWLRRVGEYEGGDIAGLAGLVNNITYKVIGPQGNELTTGKAKVNAAGGWDTTFKLPDTPNLGYAYITFEAKGRGIVGSHYHGFQIQEFRRPEYEVTAEVSQGPHLVGGSADITATASYYAGGGLQGAPVNWYLTANQTTYTPPNRDEYVFGTWVPWWGWRSWWDDTPYVEPKSWSHTATTDALGQHVLHLDFVSVNPATPMSVVAYGTVSDVNRQAWAATTSVLVHPSTAYIGLKAKKPFVEKGQSIELDGLVVDLDGKMAPNLAYEVKAVRLEWEFEKGKYITKEVDEQTCGGTSTADPFACEFVPSEGGQYQITAVTADAKGRRNQTEMTIWVAGGDVPPSRDLTQEQINLIPDAKEYADGDTAEILVQSPFYPAQGLMTVRRSGIVTTERFEMTGPTTTLKVPIKDAYVPNVYVQVDLVGKAPRLGDDGKPKKDLPERPAYGLGLINLPVPAKQRTLTVEVKPQSDKVTPGEKTAFDVLVKDAAGRAGAGRRGRADRRRRGDPRPLGVPVRQPGRRLLHVPLHGRLRPPLPPVREAQQARRPRAHRRHDDRGPRERGRLPARRCRGQRQHARRHGRHRVDRARYHQGLAEGRQEGQAGGREGAACRSVAVADAATGRRAGAAARRRGADQLRPARRVRARGQDRRRRPREDQRDDARQPDPLPRRRDRGRRRPAVRQGRERGHRAAAADGAAVAAALPQLRRHLRAAGDRPEPDRRADDGQAGGPRHQRADHRRRRPRGQGAGPGPRRGPLPGGRRDGGHRALPAGRRLRRVQRRRRGRAAGVDAGDHRGVRDLRRDR